MRSWPLLCMALLLLVLGPGCGSGGYDPDSIAARVCARMQDCGMLPAGFEDLCLATTRSLEMYVIDPETVGACVSAADCAALQAEDSTTVSDCLDLDPSSFACQGTAVLHYCNNSGACVELDCLEGCRNAFDDVSGATCGFDQEDQHDKCLCYQ